MITCTKLSMEGKMEVLVLTFLITEGDKDHGKETTLRFPIPEPVEKKLADGTVKVIGPFLRGDFRPSFKQSVLQQAMKQFYGPKGAEDAAILQEYVFEVTKAAKTLRESPAGVLQVAQGIKEQAERVEFIFGLNPLAGEALATRRSIAGVLNSFADGCDDPDRATSENERKPRKKRDTKAPDEEPTRVIYLKSLKPKEARA